MQLRTFLQISDNIFERDTFCKNKTKLDLPDQYSMYLPGIYSEVIYILVSIKNNIGKDMDKGHYVWDVLDYNKGTQWNCDDDTIPQYPGYPMNVDDAGGE